VEILYIFFIVVAPLIVGAIGQIYVYRKNINRSIGGSTALGFGLGLITLLCGYFFCIDEVSADRLAAVILIYSCGGYTFFHINNMGETARRIRISLELKQSPKGLNYDNLVARYNSDIQISRRLNRLLEAKEIKKQGGVFFLNRYRFLAMYYIVDIFKRIVFGANPKRYRIG